MTDIKYINTIHIMSGVPGSGKSTFISEHAADNAIILCRDKWRDSQRQLLNSEDYFPFSRKEEYRLWAAYVEDAILHGSHFSDIWIDQTSCRLGSIVKLLKTIRAAIDKLTTRDYDILIHIMETPYDVCTSRNAAREGKARVPQIIIDRMWATRKFSYKEVRDAVPELCIDFDHIGQYGEVVKVLEA